MCLLALSPIFGSDGDILYQVGLQLSCDVERNDLENVVFDRNSDIVIDDRNGYVSIKNEKRRVSAPLSFNTNHIINNNNNNNNNNGDRNDRDRGGGGGDREFRRDDRRDDRLRDDRREDRSGDRRSVLSPFLHSPSPLPPPSLHSCILSLCSHIPLSSLISQPQQFFTLIDLTSLAQVVRFTMRKHLSSTH